MLCSVIFFQSKKVGYSRCTARQADLHAAKQSAATKRLYLQLIRLQCYVSSNLNMLNRWVGKQRRQICVLMHNRCTRDALNEAWKSSHLYTNFAQCHFRT